jgi:hypothetical protein
MEQHRKAMSNLANWSDLERRGLLPPTPGRQEAAEAALKQAAAKKAAQNATVKPSTNRK